MSPPPWSGFPFWTDQDELQSSQFCHNATRPIPGWTQCCPWRLWSGSIKTKPLPVITGLWPYNWIIPYFCLIGESLDVAKSRLDQRTIHHACWWQNRYWPLQPLQTWFYGHNDCVGKLTRTHYGFWDRLTRVGWLWVWMWWWEMERGCDNQIICIYSGCRSFHMHKCWRLQSSEHQDHFATLHCLSGLYEEFDGTSLARHDFFTSSTFQPSGNLCFADMGGEPPESGWLSWPWSWRDAITDRPMWRDHIHKLSVRVRPMEEGRPC